MKLRRSRRPKEPIPRVGPKTHDAGKARFQVAKLYCAHQRREVSAERTQSRAILEARVYCLDQKHRGASERRGDGLRNSPWATSRFGRAHRIGLHLDIILAGCAEVHSRTEFAPRADLVDKLIIYSGLISRCGSRLDRISMKVVLVVKTIFRPQ